MATNTKTPRGRGRNNSKESTDDDQIKTMLAEMNARLMSMPTKDDLRSLDRNIRREIAGNTAKIREIEDKVDAQAHGLTALVKKEVVKTVQELGACPGLSAAHRDSFLVCRRSIRIWPILPNTDGIVQAARCFFRDILEMDPQQIIKVEIESVKEIADTPRSKISREVLVLFQCVEDRDIVYSHANRLSKHTGKAGIRLEIPEHLRSDFRLLETHGNAVRASQGPNVKRSIRFDDAEMSLVLNIKLGEHDPWVSVDISQAREAKRIKKKKAVQCIRNVYDRQSGSNVTSPVAKALGLSSGSQAAFVDPYRETSKSNPFGNLRDEPESESMSDMD